MRRESGAGARPPAAGRPPALALAARADASEEARPRIEPTPCAAEQAIVSTRLTPAR